MRTAELIAAIILAMIVFIALKLLGLFLKFALIAAAAGFIAGLLLARMLRAKSS